MIGFGTKKRSMLQSTRMPKLPDVPVYTIKEAAQATGYNEEHLRRMIREEKIVAYKVGIIYLVDVASLENYLSQADDTEDRRYGPKR